MSSKWSDYRGIQADINPNPPECRFPPRYPRSNFSGQLVKGGGFHWLVCLTDTFPQL